MKEVIADKNYFFDADGNVTTDESKGERWLAREGAAVLSEYQEALEAFQSRSGKSKAAPAENARQADTAKAETVADDAAGAPKSTRASSNKAKTPAKNK